MSVCTDASQYVIIYACVTVNQLVSGGDHHAPWNLGMLLSNRFRYVGGGLAKEFDVAYRGVLTHGIAGKFSSARFLCECQNALTKTDHVIDVKTPLPLRRPVRHVPPRAPRKDEFLFEVPSG